MHRQRNADSIRDGAAVGSRLVGWLGVQVMAE